MGFFRSIFPNILRWTVWPQVHLKARTLRRTVSNLHTDIRSAIWLQTKAQRPSFDPFLIVYHRKTPDRLLFASVAAREHSFCEHRVHHHIFKMSLTSRAPRAQDSRGSWIASSALSAADKRRGLSANKARMIDVGFQEGHSTPSAHLMPRLHKTRSLHFWSSG